MMIFDIIHIYDVFQKVYDTYPQKMFKYKRCQAETSDGAKCVGCQRQLDFLTLVSRKVGEGNWVTARTPGSVVILNPRQHPALAL